MPVNEYYAGKGQKVMASMKREYGAKKGEQVFYATAAARNEKPRQLKTEPNQPGGGGGRKSRQPAKTYYRPRKKGRLVPPLLNNQAGAQATRSNQVGYT